MRGFAWLVIAAAAGISLAASMGHAPRYLKYIPGEHTGAHILVTLALSLAANLGFADSVVRGRRLGIAGVTALVLGVVTLEELSQRWLSTRAVQTEDLVANAAGILTGALVAWWLRSRRER
jgi:VanZ family protein